MTKGPPMKPGATLEGKRPKHSALRKAAQPACLKHLMRGKHPDRKLEKQAEASSNAL